MVFVSRLKDKVLSYHYKMSRASRNVAHPSHKLKDSSLKNFARHHVGIDRISLDSPAEMRTFVTKLTKKLAVMSMDVAQHSRRKTIKYKDLEYAAESLGVKTLLGSEDLEVARMVRKDGKYKLRNNSQGTRRNTGKYTPVYLSNTGIRSIVESETGDMRLSAGFLASLQVIVEAELLKVLASAKKLSMEIGERKGVQGKDIRIAVEESCIMRKL